MKLNLHLMKLIIRTIILLILFVVLFFICTVLYSAKYWPDVYNYINANITIKRIPTISEITVYEIGYVTEQYSTTDPDYIDTTIDTTEEYFVIDEFDFPKRMKRNVEIENIKDYSDVPTKGVLVDYIFIDEEEKVIKDLIDESKLTPKDLKDVEILGEIRDKVKDNYEAVISEAVFPWISAIFIKNDSMKNQFEYYCDGAILKDRFVLTAARCLQISNRTVDAGDLLIVPGKRSLHSVGDNEKAHRVKTIWTHDNFTINDGVVRNDLSLLELEELVSFNNGVQRATLAQNSSTGLEAVTTGWRFSGELTPISFNKEASATCNVDTENTFCATYGSSVSTCPSYGGLYATRQTDKWYLQGIRSGDPAVRVICVSRDIIYTNLEKYTNWIESVISN